MSSLILLLLGSASLWAQTQDIAVASKDDWEAILFAPRSSVVAAGYPTLLRLADLLQKNPEYRVRLEGHTDGLEARISGAARQLALARAQAVGRFLVKYGAAAGQIEAVAADTAGAKARQQTPEQRLASRSVTISVREAEGRIVSAGGSGETIKAMQDPVGVQRQDLEQIMKRLERLDDLVAAQKDLGERLDAMGRAITLERAPAHAALPDDLHVRQIGRALLLPGSKEPDNYGLYSYVLFPVRPANDEQRTRYLQVLEAYLRLNDMSAVEASLKADRQFDTRQLHRSLVPVDRTPDEMKAEALLKVYDYVRASRLIEQAGLRQSARSRTRGGPYLVCVLQPLSGAVPRERLVQFLDWVPPGDLVNAWFQFFLSRAATPREWEKKSLYELALNAQTWVETLSPTVIKTGTGVMTSVLWFTGKSAKTPSK